MLAFAGQGKASGREAAGRQLPELNPKEHQVVFTKLLHSMTSRQCLRFSPSILPWVFDMTGRGEQTDTAKPDITKSSHKGLGPSTLVAAHNMRSSVRSCTWEHDGVRAPRRTRPGRHLLCSKLGWKTCRRAAKVADRFRWDAGGGERQGSGARHCASSWQLC